MLSGNQREVTKAEVRQAISDIDNLIAWTSQYDKKNKALDLAIRKADDASQFFKDLLL